LGCFCFLSPDVLYCFFDVRILLSCSSPLMLLILSPSSWVELIVVASSETSRFGKLKRVLEAEVDLHISRLFSRSSVPGCPLSSFFVVAADPFCCSLGEGFSPGRQVIFPGFLTLSLLDPFDLVSPLPFLASVILTRPFSLLALLLCLFFLL